MEYYGYIYLILLPQGSVKGIPDLPKLRPFYFGQKKGKVKDTYFGSGTTIREWFKSKGFINSSRINSTKAYSVGVERYIICYAYSEQELNKLESFFIDPVLNTPGCLNRKEGGKSGKLIEEIWTVERKLRQSQILKKYDENRKKSHDYITVAERRKNHGLLLSEWAKQDKINNPEKYSKMYESSDLRKRYSDVQITAWQDEDRTIKAQLSWSKDKRKSASLRETAKWTEDKRAERSKLYKEYKHWTNGVEDVYRKDSPGKEWVPAQMGTKKACKLLGIEFTSEIKELAKFYFIQKRRKKLRKHNK